MSLIDLDQPADRAADDERQPLSRSRVGVVAVVALLIGAVLSGLVTHRWTVQRAEAADGRKVSVLLFPEERAGGSDVVSVANSDGTTQTMFPGVIAVVNAGPRPVELRSLAAHAADVTVTGPAEAQWISPGTSLPVTVTVVANCNLRKADGGIRATVGGGVMQATASVRTSGGSTATVTSLSLDTGRWASTLMTAVNKCLLAPT